MQNRVSFIVAERSYLVRKGIVSIINRIEHASVVKELDSLEWIQSEISSHKPDFVVINTGLISKETSFRNFTLNIDLSKQGVAILSQTPGRTGLAIKFREIINIDDPREIILGKFQALIEPASVATNPATLSGDLSEREKSIVALVARGLTNKEIADKLFLSQHTVVTHRKNITGKLGIKSISGLTIYAILNNLVSLKEIGLK
jgi:two-component system, NarL family, response regulator NreC